MKIIGTILVTYQACYEVKLKELELDANRWVVFAVDMLEICSMKEFIAEDEAADLGDTHFCSAIYLKNGANFIIKEDFKELLHAWSEMLEEHFGSNNNIIGLN